MRVAFLGPDLPGRVDRVLPVGGQAVGACLLQTCLDLADVLGVLGVGERLPIRLTKLGRVRGLSAVPARLLRPRGPVGFKRRGRVAGRESLQPLPKFVAVA